MQMRRVDRYRLKTHNAQQKAHTKMLLDRRMKIGINW